MYSELKQKAKAWAIEKLGGKCHDCKIKSKYQEIYDFHHENGKNKREKRINVLKWFNAQKIPFGIILLCSNCHRIRTRRIRLKYYSKCKKPLISKSVLSKEFNWKFGS